MKRVFLPVLVIASAMSLPSAGRAQTEVTLIAPGGIRSAVQQLIPGFEQKTGYKVNPTFGSGGGTKQQVARGEVFDVPILQPPYPEVLASGNVIEGSATPLASVAVGIAVKLGSPKPDISTPEALKKLLLSVKSISLPDPALGGAAGVSFRETLKKLGIADEVEAKFKPAQGGGAAMAMVAKGEVEIGVTFLSEMSDPGIDKAGALPKEVSPRTALVGFVSTHAKNPQAAKALLQYLSAPEAAPVYRSLGMEPSR